MTLLKKTWFGAAVFASILSAESSKISHRFVPTAQTASVEGQEALWHNPAGLAFMGGQEYSLGYLYEWSDLGDRHHGGLNFALNFWSLFTLGLGLNTKAAFTEIAKHNLGTDLGGILGAAVKLTRNSSFGLSVLKSHNFLENKTSSALVSFGFQARPWSFLAVGGHYEEIHEGFFSAPNLTAGVAVRPYKEYLTIGLDTKWAALGKDWGQGFRLDPKLSLRGALGGLGAAVSAEIPGLKEGFNKPIFGFTMDFNLAHLGLSLEGLVNTHGHNYALGSSLRIHSEETPSLINSTGLWVELSVEHDGSLERIPMSIAQRFFVEEESPLSVLALLKRIESDRMIGGVLINIFGFSFGDARTEEWRDAILALRKAGKEVVVFLYAPSERDYYVASAANQIFMNKESSLSLQNFQATLVYFADLLEKVGVKAHAIVAGSYKTAPRQWTNSRPQKEEIEVMNNILNNFYATLLTDIAAARNIDRDKLKELFDKGEITANDAFDAGLVDYIVQENEVSTTLDSKDGGAKTYFAGYENRRFKQLAWHRPKRIVVIPITHTIADGRAEPGLFSGLSPKTHAKDVVDEIEDAVEDPNVIGIIVRIDSPGGGVLSSSRISEALTQAQKTKPVVASMSDVAASGGYMVAAGTNHILALPNTITGSIGVFSLMFEGEKLKNKIGVFSKELSPLKNPGPTMFRGPTEQERIEAQRVVDWYYRNFIDIVKNGLKLSEEEVRKEAQGHVWLGSEALAKKLVNELGGFSQSIDRILLLAERPQDEKVIIDVRKPGLSDQLNFGSRLRALFGAEQLSVDIKNLAPLARPYLEALEAYRLNGQPQSRLPFDIEWAKRPKQ